MILLRHRQAASNRQSGMWEYDAQRKCVIVVIQCGAADPVCLDMSVCVDARPRHASFCIARRDESTWVIAPAAYFLEDDVWVARATTYDTNLPPEFIELACAPPDIALELAEL